MKLIAFILCFCIPSISNAEAFLKTQPDVMLKSGNVAVCLKSTYLKNVPTFEYTHRSDYAINGPTVSFVFGLSDRDEFEASWDILRYSKIQNKGFIGVADVSFFNKIKILKEDRYPSLDFRVGVKLPNASRSTYSGTDQADTFMWGILGKQLGNWHFFSNLGMELLGNPLSGQDDAWSYGFAVSHLLVNAWTWSSELAGRYENRGSSVNNADIRTGLSYLFNPSLKFEMGFSHGLISQSARFAATTGVTGLFDVF